MDVEALSVQLWARFFTLVLFLNPLLCYNAVQNREEAVRDSPSVKKKGT